MGVIGAGRACQACTTPAAISRKLFLPLPAEDPLEQGLLRGALLLERGPDLLILPAGYREALARVLITLLDEGQFIGDAGTKAQIERRPPEDTILEFDHSTLGLALDVDRDTLWERTLRLGPLAVLGRKRLDRPFALVFAENLVGGGRLAVLEQILFIVF